VEAGEVIRFAPGEFQTGYAVEEEGNEVTGWALGAVAPLGAEGLGRARLPGRQASARGGTVRCEARGERVGLGGPAVTVLRGALAV
jgi:predicted PhzF superfamily epimerase YddE/YHI9